MPFKVLYYPDYDIDPNWLKTILLFVDQVYRIVPEDDIRDCNPILELKSIIPDSIVDITPSTSDKSLEGLNKDLIDKAFKSIYESYSPETLQEVEFLIKGSSVKIMGHHIFLHQDKISEYILKQLEKYKLIVNDLPNFQESLGDRKRFNIVNKDASSLILSYIADNVAKKYGLDTITDKSIGYVFNRLSDFRVNPMGSVEGALLSSMISCVVPDVIQFVNIENYKEVRESYADVRTHFQKITRELAQNNRLDRIQDAKMFDEMAHTIANEFFEECLKYKNSSQGKLIKHWSTFFAEGLLTFTGMFMPSLAFASNTGKLALKVIADKLKQDAIPPEKKQLYNLVCNLRGNIIAQSPVKKFII